METSSSSSSSSAASEEESPTFSDLSLRETLLFSDSLKDLRDLRSQLYSAAEYFELSYSSDEHKQTVVDSLKDYAVKALVNTVDHLGSVSCKVDGFLCDKVVQVSAAELRVNSIEQRLRTCQGMMDKEGRAQQELIITAPKYHKRYILPEGGSMPLSGGDAVAYHEDLKPKEAAVDLPTIMAASAAHPILKESAPALRKFRSLSPTQRGRSISPQKKGRAPSPSPQLSVPPPLSEDRAGSLFPHATLARSGSLPRRQPAPNPSGNGNLWFGVEPRKSASVRQQDYWNDQKDAEQSISKTKRLFKALLSRRKSRKDDMLYAYLDEY
ncbi:putative protein ABIL2 [Wolffia australiana]